MLPPLVLAFSAAVILAGPSAYAAAPIAIDKRAPGLRQRDVAPELDGRVVADTIHPGGTTLQRRAYNVTKVSGNGRPVGTKSCPGTPITTPIPIASDRATVNIYYSTKDNGTNCAYLENKTPEPQFMYIKLYSVSDPESFSSDMGYEYARFAGSVSVTNMSGSCIGMDVNFDGRWWHAPENFHCGA